MATRRPFALVYAEEIKHHLRAVEKKYHAQIRAEIEQQLLFEPEVETRNRKPLKRPLCFGAEWELRLGPDNRFRVFDQVQAKIVKVDDGEAVATRIKQGHGKELGFGGYTDVLHNEEMGLVKLVGPIPEEVQNYTFYSSALIAAAPKATPARAIAC